MSIATIDRYRLLAEFSPNQEPLIVALLAAASSRIEKFCGRGIEQKTVTERAHGANTYRIVPFRYPIIAVSAFSVDGTSWAAYLGPSANQAQNVFSFDDRFIYSHRGRIATGFNNVEYTYTGGYAPADIPEDLQQACCEMVMLYLQERTRVGHTSKSIQGETTSFTTAEMPSNIKGKLLEYKDVIC